MTHRFFLNSLLSSILLVSLSACGGASDSPYDTEEQEVQEDKKDGNQPDNHEPVDDEPSGNKPADDEPEDTEVDSNNTAPKALSLNIIDNNGGKLLEGDVLSGQYTYEDAEGDVAGVSLYRWLRNGIAISAADSTSYTIKDLDKGQVITFEVTPVAATGISLGATTLSNGVTIEVQPSLVTNECTVFTQEQPDENNLPVGQQYTSVQAFVAGSYEDGSDLYYLGQQTQDSRLVLGANEHFHDYKNGITLGGSGPTDLPNMDLNKEKSYEYIDGWSDVNNTLIWGLWFEQAGDVNIALRLGIDEVDAGAEISLNFGNQTSSCITQSTGIKSQPQTMFNVPFTVPSPGFYQLELAVNTLTGSEVGRLYRMDMTGSATKDAQVLRARWRPGAVHAQFLTSLNDRPKRMWVLEVTPSEFENWFYAPATTQFGYFGSGRKRGGEVAGVNFSMWSFGKSDDEPVIEQLSHLIAAGSQQAELDGFSHEGTGVKVRNWNPYDGIIPSQQVLALRMEPGNPYDTYYGYFLDPKTQHWQLFAVGRKFNDGEPNENVTVGSFVEVVGPSSNTRTGSKQREVAYRGWYQDDLGEWAAMDTIDFNDKAGEIVNKSWHAQGNKMLMRMGGLAHHQGENGNQVKTITDFIDMPFYLQGAYLDELHALPAQVKVMQANNISANSATVRFKIDDMGDNAKVMLYWGDQEALTFSDRWQNSIEIEEPTLGTNSIPLDALEANTNYFYRVYIENDQGKTWSLETQAFTTLAP